MFDVKENTKEEGRHQNLNITWQKETKKRVDLTLEYEVVKGKSVEHVCHTDQPS